MSKSSEFLIKMAININDLMDLPEDPDERKKDLSDRFYGAGLIGATLAAPRLAGHAHDYVAGQSRMMTDEEMVRAMKDMGVKELPIYRIDRGIGMYSLPGNRYGPRSVPRMDPLTGEKSPRDLRLGDIELRRLGKKRGWIKTPGDVQTTLHELGHAKDLQDGEAKWYRRLRGLSRHVLPVPAGAVGAIVAGGSDPTVSHGRALLRSAIGGGLGGIVGGLPTTYSEGKASILAALQAQKQFGTGWKTFGSLLPAFGTYVGSHAARGMAGGVITAGLARMVRKEMLKRKLREQKNKREPKLSSQ